MMTYIVVMVVIAAVIAAYVLADSASSVLSSTRASRADAAEPPPWATPVRSPKTTVAFSQSSYLLVTYRVVGSSDVWPHLGACRFVQTSGSISHPSSHTKLISTVLLV